MVEARTDMYECTGNGAGVDSESDADSVFLLPSFSDKEKKGGGRESDCNRDDLSSAEETAKVFFGKDRAGNSFGKGCSSAISAIGAAISCFESSKGDIEGERNSNGISISPVVSFTDLNNGKSGAKEEVIGENRPVTAVIIGIGGAF